MRSKAELVSDYRILIRNWHNKPLSAGDIFSNFVFEYLAFIATLRTQIFSEEGLTDRNIIQQLKRRKATKDKYIELISTDIELNAVWKEIKNELDEYPLGHSPRSPYKVELSQYWRNSSDKKKKVPSIDDGTLKGLDTGKIWLNFYT